MAEDKSWTREKIKSKIEGNELDLSLCEIVKVPVKPLVPFTKITSLDLSCNKIHILPDDFVKLTHLVQIDLSKNSLTELPKDFGQLIKLKKLDLLQNHISDLPISFRQLNNLIWLDLKGNPIQDHLPNVVGDCLKPKECQSCARNTIEHYQVLFEEFSEKERKRKKKENEKLAKQLREEDVLRQRRKDEKRRRFEEKKLSEYNQPLKKVSNEEESRASPADACSGNDTSSKTNIYCRCLFFLVTFMIVTIITCYVLFKDVVTSENIMYELIKTVDTHVKNFFNSIIK